MKKIMKDNEIVGEIDDEYRLFSINHMRVFAYFFVQIAILVLAMIYDENIILLWILLFLQFILVIVFANYNYILLGDD